MPEFGPVRRIVEFNFTDADSAVAAFEALNVRIAEAAELVGAKVVQQEFIIDESSAYDPNGKLLDEFRAHVSADTDLFNDNLQERLDMCFVDILPDYNGLDVGSRKQRTRMIKAMQRDSISSVRDVFIRGTFSLWDIKGFGPSFIDTIQAACREHVPEIPLMLNTSPVIVAQFCKTLDQIVLTPHKRGVSISALLAGDVQGTAALLEVDAEVAVYIRNRAQQYADEFSRAKDAQRLRDL